MRKRPRDDPVQVEKTITGQLPQVPESERAFEIPVSEYFYRDFVVEYAHRRALAMPVAVVMIVDRNTFVIVDKQRSDQLRVCRGDRCVQEVQDPAMNRRRESLCFRQAIVLRHTLSSADIAALLVRHT
jgi:hypothetical protein